MNRRTQNILYHLLPVVFWLLAAGGIVLWEIYNVQFTIFNYIPALLAWISVLIIHRIPRHGDAIEPSFQMALLLGIAAYWLPSVLLLILPLWGYLIYRHLFDLRAFIATLIGLATVAIWVALLNFFQLSTFHTFRSCPWAENFQLAHNVRAWIPTGTILLAWLGSTIVRQTLRER